ncbi:hypothetical protein POM88_024147 [Heracleum sosnowskyi]|uniref:Uncharacterized protein n=1 Tax=Heracleum sosnowskyi TaxID=360622 RepID=A0AAD8MMK6_9APIA|nr:hypothetical protein POM88_024147 [Heracleum sosnowskyi]
MMRQGWMHNISYRPTPLAQKPTLLSPSLITFTSWSAYSGLDGISLVEVFNLTYLGRDEIEPDKQLGSIVLEFDSGSKKIYYQNKVVKSNPTIKFGDTIFVTDELTGPICSLNELDMQFNLFLGAYKGSLKLKFEPYQNRVWVEERTIGSVCGTGLIHVVFGCLSNHYKK